MSLYSERDERRANLDYIRHFSRILHNEVARRQNPLIEGVEISFISGSEWKKFSEGKSADMVAWLDPEHNPQTDNYRININFNSGMFKPPAVPNKHKEKIFRIVLEHELQEFWYILEQQEGRRDPDKDKRGRGPAHQHALECEWKLAFKLGLESEYLRCIRNWASKMRNTQGTEVSEPFLEENKAMYNRLLQENRHW